LVLTAIALKIWQD